MGAGPVTFDYTAWTARYPEFAGVSQDLATVYFAEACIYCDNTANSPVSDPNVLKALLNMATAHIAALNAPQLDGQYNDQPGSMPNSSQVGRVASATEGTVSVALDMPNQPASAAWWQQTKYGSAFWQATAVYRTFQYQPSPRFLPGHMRPFGWLRW